MSQGDPLARIRGLVRLSQCPAARDARQKQAPVACLDLSTFQPASNAVRPTVAAEKQTAQASALEGTNFAGLTCALVLAGRQVESRKRLVLRNRDRPLVG